MKIRLALSVVLGCALAACASAQNPDSNANPAPASPSSGASPAPGQGSGNGPRGNRGGFGGGAGMGRGLSGTVTEVAADHYTIKSFTGDTYTVHFSADTRMFKQTAGQRGGGQGRSRGQGQAQNQNQGQDQAQDQAQDQPRAQGQAGSGGRFQGRGYGGNPPQQIKPADIKVGDAITAAGEIDTAAKSVGATAVVLLDPERAKQMQAMDDSYGKTWLMGKVTAIDGVKVTVDGSVDNAPHSFVADENTTFRRRRDPITLADIQVGDTVRADGAVKDSVFTAATVSVMGATPGGNATVPGPGGAPKPPQ